MGCQFVTYWGGVSGPSVTPWMGRVGGVGGGGPPDPLSPFMDAFILAGKQTAGSDRKPQRKCLSVCGNIMWTTNIVKVLVIKIKARRMVPERVGGSKHTQTREALSILLFPWTQRADL